MCGIVGALWRDEKLSVDDATLGRMTDALRHRGPDDSGQYRSEIQTRSAQPPLPGVALGFRRLSIIDLVAGRQPMSNEDGTVWMVFNGEIYNDLQLRRRLEGAGHRFQSHCDAETVVHLYEDEGLECFSMLNGMFALAIWDQRKGRLVLARDRLGQKPLVYRQEPSRLLFASELKSLLLAPHVPREIEPAAIDEYLTYQYVPHPRSILRGCNKLAPGHLAVWQDGRLETRRYWNVDFSVERPMRAVDAAEQFRELLASAVSMRMRSDVPLGAFLSGGVDSSLIVALMQQASDRPVKTFSIGFSERQFDETRYARLVADHVGAEHHRFAVTPDMLDVLPQLVWHFDEPMADSSAIPTWYVSQLTRQHVTVALSGDGGDELLVGYPRHRAAGTAAALDRLPLARRALSSGLWRSLLPPPWRMRAPFRQAWRFARPLRRQPVRRYLDWVGIFDEVQRADLYRQEFLEQLPDRDPIEFLAAAWRQCGRRPDAQRAALGDLASYLPCDLMCKVDIASMAHSLEVRQPFLDYRLVEFAAQLPLRLHYRWGRGKRLLRQACGPLLPRSIWNRKKQGFGVPLASWFRGQLRELLHDTLTGELTRQRGWMRPEAIAQLLGEHDQGQADHSHRLWALLVLELWAREHLDRRPATMEQQQAPG